VWRVANGKWTQTNTREHFSRALEGFKPPRALNAHARIYELSPNFNELLEHDRAYLMRASRMEVMYKISNFVAIYIELA
jgi:hypothetical protein